MTANETTNFVLPELTTDMQLDAFEYVKELVDAPENIWNEYTLIYYDHWSSYEESGSLLILEKNGEYFSLHGGYSVSSDTNDDETWNDLEPVLGNEIYEMIENMQSTVSENNRHMHQ